MSANPPAAAAPPRKRSLKFRLVAGLVATVLSLLLAEGAVRVVAPQALSGTWRDWTAGYPVNRAATTVRHQYKDRSVVYRFNDQGLRGAAVDPSAFRVLCLGDSFTFGWLVDEPDTYVGLLQARADAAHGAGRVQFLNAGVGGGNTATALAFLEDRGDTIKPDAVLCFLNCWDIGRALQAELYVPAPGATDGRLDRRTPEAPVSGASRAMSRIPGYGWLLEHSHLVQFVRNIAARASQRDVALAPGGAPPSDTDAPRGAATADDPDLDRRACELGRALFLRMKAWCDAHRVPLWVVTTGRPYERPKDGKRTPSGHLEATIAFVAAAPAFFRDAKIAFADTTPLVSADCGGDFRNLQIPGEGHPNEQGSKIIARHAWDAVAPWLAAGLAAKQQSRK